MPEQTHIADGATVAETTLTPDTVPDDREPHVPTCVRKIGQYEILCEIGRGGMGVVYKARDSKLGRIAALKVIKAGEFATPEEVARFQGEASAAGRLDHPGIVPVYEFGRESERYYMALAYVEGRSLWDMIRESPIEPRIAASVIQQAAEAAQYAHDHGVVHRDLKPHNVLITPDGKSRITDFGLAKSTVTDASLTATGQVLGTPAYMPPEQAIGNCHQAGPLVDVYSLGATLYCALTGRPPFQAANQVQTLHLVATQDVISPRRLNPTISRDLETICLKCLQKEPSHRYGSAVELSTDLRRWLAGEPILARSASRAERCVRWTRRNPVLSSLIVSVALILVIASALVASSQYAGRLSVAVTELERKNAELDRLNKALADSIETEKHARIAAERQRKFANEQKERALMGEQKAKLAQEQARRAEIQALAAAKAAAIARQQSRDLEEELTNALSRIQQLEDRLKMAKESGSKGEDG